MPTSLTKNTKPSIINNNVCIQTCLKTKQKISKCTHICIGVKIPSPFHGVKIPSPFQQKTNNNIESYLRKVHLDTRYVSSNLHRVGLRCRIIAPTNSPSFVILFDTFTWRAAAMPVLFYYTNVSPSFSCVFPSKQQNLAQIYSSFDTELGT